MGPPPPVAPAVVSPCGNHSLFDTLVSQGVVAQWMPRSAYTLTLDMVNFPVELVTATLPLQSMPSKIGAAGGGGVPVDPFPPPCVQRSAKVPKVLGLDVERTT